MTRIIPTIAFVTLATPALAHPGHDGGAGHWLAFDHLAMLGTLAALAGGLIWRNAARTRVAVKEENRREDC